MNNKQKKIFNKLGKSIDGELLTDKSIRILYSTDASAYREMPIAVCYPKHSDDIRKLISFATKHRMTLIPRAAGTSLAGQVVGHGIIADISKHMTQVLEINPQERWVRVEPGVNLDELNIVLKKHGLFFGPETSTANRCMIGGMVGNNACGLHSLVYGSTRDHTLSVKALASDGTELTFTSLTNDEFNYKCQVPGIEGNIYRTLQQILSDKKNAQEIREQYPDPRNHRRNTGYAIDLLLECEPFTPGGEKFNLCKLIAGSEGTLVFITEIKLNLVPLPPPVRGLLCVHCRSVEEAIQANLIGLKYKPQAIELMDNKILELTKGNIEQRKNRFFVEGDPGAILIIELAGETKEQVATTGSSIEQELRQNKMGYHYPMIYGADIKKVWDLRKAGLGVLSNMPGDAKPVSVIEDTSVHPEQLSEYIREFNGILKKYKLECVYHAHIATGELHLRPIINLKTKEGIELFHAIAFETAKLVKKYRGSLSGEHGDGRLRGEFIPLMVGEKNYRLLKQIKSSFDPMTIFNAGKIIDTPPMNTMLRYEPGGKERTIKTIFDFSATGGILRAAEQCNGSGDCRKSHIIGGTMCPSYMATRDERHVTRARANMLREFLTHSKRMNPFDHKELYEILELCISCKACKAECPSNVDIAKLKAEFLQHYYDANGTPLRALLVGNITLINQLGSLFPRLTNTVLGSRLVRSIAFPLVGFSPHRQMPSIHPYPFTRWRRKNSTQPNPSKGKVCLFVDEFSEYNDTVIAEKCYKLLVTLGFEVLFYKHTLSGRTYLSKGLLRKARKLADTNVRLLSPMISADIPLIGIEPSAILAFRDEYPDLVKPPYREAAKNLAKHVFLIDEFLVQQIEKKQITQDQFTKEKKDILLHGHCQQKAIASTATTIKMLSFPINYTVSEIPSGCCGMAGSFGFEKEHYDISMKIGELVLFPAVRLAGAETIISAPGTSCRHQIKDGTGRNAYHPIEILYDALAVPGQKN